MGEVLHCWFLNFYEFVSFDKLRTNGIGTITRVLSVAFTTEPDEVSGRTGEIILAVNKDRIEKINIALKDKYE